MLANNKINKHEFCINENISYDEYNTLLKNKWNELYNKKMFICKENNLISKINEVKNVIEDGIDIIQKYNAHNKNINYFMFDLLLNKILLSNDTSFKPQYYDNFIAHLKVIFIIMKNNIGCYINDIINTLNSENDDDKKTKIKNILSSFGQINIDNIIYYVLNAIKLIFNNELELEKIKISNFTNDSIPEDLNSMKTFLNDIFDEYFGKLHPIVWAQIFKDFLLKITNDMPTNLDDFLKIIVQSFLFNSGPIILKIMQLIRPLLKIDIVKKYGLEKLRYPLMNEDEYNLFLKMHINGEFKIINTASASVGQIVFIKHNSKKIVIKILKPITIAQSCWEFNLLHDFVSKNKNILNYINNIYNSLDGEYNTLNEKTNMNEMHKHYKCTYNDFIENTVCKNILTTITSCDDVLKNKELWFMLAMTNAEGESLEKIISKTNFSENTKYVSSIHRCFDLLIYKFFNTLINKQCYHGDLHSGNIYYSHENKTMTIIDFGAIGKLDLKDENTNNMISIILASVYYCYDDIFDIITEIINNKSNIKINKFDNKYIDVQTKLKNIQEHLIKCEQKYDYLSVYDKFGKYIFSETRCKLENDTNNDNINDKNSIYANMLIYQNKLSVILDETLNDFTLKYNKSCILNEKETIDYNNIGFSTVLQMMFDYFKECGVVVPIILYELFELQKAYMLLIGVMNSIKYPQIRMSYILKDIFGYNIFVNNILDQTIKILNVSLPDALNTVYQFTKSIIKTPLKITNTVKNNVGILVGENNQLFIHCFIKLRAYSNKYNEIYKARI